MQAAQLTISKPTQHRASTLHCRDLQVGYRDKPCCAPFTWQLTSGMALEVRGANGRGKTTLLRVLSGLQQPVSGTVMWNGSPIHRDGAAHGQRVVWIGHQVSRSAYETVWERAMLEAQLVQSDVAAEAMGRRHLQQWGLWSHRHDKVSELSHGQKKKLMLLRLQDTQAPLWLLDEPCSGLDAQAVAWLQDACKQHMGQGGMVVYTTHQADSLVSSCARLDVLL